MAEFTDFQQTPDAPVVRAHVVTDDTAGEYVTRGANGPVATNVTTGSVLTETDRPGVYDLISSADWEKMGMAGTSGGDVSPVVADPTAEADDTADDDLTL